MSTRQNYRRGAIRGSSHEVDVGHHVHWKAKDRRHMKKRSQDVEPLNARNSILPQTMENDKATARTNSF